MQTNSPKVVLLDSQKVRETQVFKAGKEGVLTDTQKDGSVVVCEYAVNSSAKVTITGLQLGVDFTYQQQQ